MQKYLQTLTFLELDLVIPVIEHGLKSSENMMKVNELMHNKEQTDIIKKQIAEAQCLLSLLYLLSSR